MEELIPWLYLKGVSTGDFGEALSALLGTDAVGLSPSTVSRLTQSWAADYQAWQQRDLSGKRYVHLWADGVYPQVRMEDPNPCLLVIISADESGRKELLGVWDGCRESELSWKEVLLDLKRRGLGQPPKIAVGDGALGFWKALAQVYPSTRAQRCWVHKTKNVLNRLPKRVQPHAKEHLHRGLRRQVSQGGGLSHQRPGGTAHLLRLPGGPLASSAHDQPHRVDLRHDPSAHRQDARMSLTQHGAHHGLQARALRSEQWRRLNRSELLTDVVGGVRFQDGLKTNVHPAQTEDAA